MEKIQLNPEIHSEINDKIIYAKKVVWNLDPADLVEEIINNREGQLSDKGAICVDTGKFTGRSPEDRYIVLDDSTEDSVFWGDINKPISPEIFENLLNKVTEDLHNKTLYVRDAFVSAHDEDLSLIHI